MYPWGHDKPFNDYNTYFKGLFDQRVQKISIDAGFTCPNRDGNKARGGCTYCDNKTFNPFYCDPNKPIGEQLKEGIAFFSPKYQTQKYLAYFQAYSNTYAKLDVLKAKYEEALSVEGVIGIVIATRPDCLSDEILDYLADLSRQTFLVLEVGLESTYDPTLSYINRGHTWQESVSALRRAGERKLQIGTHIILGLPGETKEIMMQHAVKLSELPIASLKLHQLQIIKHTVMSKQFQNKPDRFKLFTAEEYVDVCIDFLELLSPNIMIERFTSESPSRMLIAPNWGGLKNYEFTDMLVKKMKQQNTWQGKLASKLIYTA